MGYLIPFIVNGVTWLEGQSSEILQFILHYLAIFGIFNFQHLYTFTSCIFNVTYSVSYCWNNQEVISESSGSKALTSVKFDVCLEPVKIWCVIKVLPTWWSPCYFMNIFSSNNVLLITVFLKVHNLQVHIPFIISFLMKLLIASCRLIYPPFLPICAFVSPVHNFYVTFCTVVIGSS
jgi:hypothetical protein